MLEFIKELFLQLSEIIYDFGYVGIFLLMFLESSFFPFPSEIVMIPAGYLASIGKMNVYLAIFFGTLGSLGGALFNYYLASKYGYSFLKRYGKYFFFNEKSLDKVNSFFAKHGLASTFIGRLLPGIRQYISLPAGMAKVDIVKFSFLTSLGAFIWVSILAIMGFAFGNVQDIDSELMGKLSWVALLVAIELILLYILVVRFRARKK